MKPKVIIVMVHPDYQYDPLLYGGVTRQFASLRACHTKLAANSR